MHLKSSNDKLLVFLHCNSIFMAVSDYLLDPQECKIPLEEIHLSNENKEALSQLLKEFQYASVLSKYDLPIANKIFLFGHTGCGKTTTARAIAHALNKKILIVDLSQVVSSKLGETAKNMAEVFRKAIREKAVLFLDEFDAIGRMRQFEDKDTGEMKRLVNSVIQLIDEIPQDTLLIAATNHSAVVDSAILRRFQLKLRFDPPTNSELDTYYDSLLARFPEKFRKFNRLYDISYAEAKDYAYKIIKAKIIDAQEV